MTAADPLVALERIKAEAREVLDNLEHLSNCWQCRFARNTLATAEFLGEQLKRHRQVEMSWTPIHQEQSAKRCIWCAAASPCSDYQSALALITQLDGGHE